MVVIPLIRGSEGDQCSFSLIKLLISKIENNQYSENERVNVIELTNKLVSTFEKVALTNNILIKTSFVNDLSIFFNPALIDILLSNLLSNAIKHNSTNGVIEINIFNRQWKISNAGNPLISSDKIFERFQKGTTNQTSTGLGLAIAKKICDMNGVTIQYEYQNNCHIFSINF